MKKNTKKYLRTNVIGVANLCALSVGAQILLPVNQNNVKVVQDEYKKAYGKRTENVDFSAERPNILFITSDQQFWMAMGYNDPTLKTPNLDRLAKMGVIYDRAYTCNPVSTPTRASMITGLYPSQHGAYALGTKLPQTVPTIGNYLKEAGYKTALIGKAHFMPLAGNADYPSLEAYPILQDLNFWKKYKGPFYGFEDVQFARNHGDESHVGQHYALWMKKKLKKQGKSTDSWKNWFVKPGSLEFAKISSEMRLVMDKNGAHGEKQSGIWNIPEDYHMNSFIAEQVNNQIDKYKKEKKPFFVWASFFDPHPPYLVPEPWASMYKPEDMILPDVAKDDLEDMPYHYRMTQTTEKGWPKKYVEDGFGVHGLVSQISSKAEHQKNKALYYGMVSMMDKYIGKILDHLEAKGLLEKTVIVFTTDHGHHIGTHNLGAKGAFAFEEDLRIPFVAAWKGHFPAGKRTDALISVVDITPTFLKLSGYKSTPTMAGKDMTRLFTGDTTKIRDWVIAENHFQRTKFYQKTYIEKRYKITWYMHSNEGELFDLEADPHEYTNLWNIPEFKELKMQLMHRAMQADMQKEPCWMPRLGPA